MGHSGRDKTWKINVALLPQNFELTSQMAK